jgi:hypothetical protein
MGKRIKKVRASARSGERTIARTGAGAERASCRARRGRSALPRST